MTLKQRIRAVTDAAPGEYRSVASIYAALSEPKPGIDTVAVIVHEMHDDKILVRRGKRRHYEYRSSARPYVAPVIGRKPGGRRLGFMGLARLERTDPEAYRKAVAADRRRG